VNRIAHAKKQETIVARQGEVKKAKLSAQQATHAALAITAQKFARRCRISEAQFWQRQ
jgi:hypothetical protein